MSIEPSLLSERVQLKSSDPGLFEWLLPESTQPGIYFVRLQTVSTMSSEQTHTIKFKVMGDVSFSSMDLFVSKKSTRSTEEVVQ